MDIPATSSNMPGTLVLRDASGNFTGNLTGNVTGNVTGNLTGTASAIADNSVTSAKIVDGTIVDADISNTAAIAATKLASDSITNTQIKSDAAIAGTKIAPNFGSQDITIGDKIIHDGDTNTAIRFPAADTVTVETAGSERMRVDSSGKVGIGTNSPVLPLHINAASGNAAIHLTTNTSGQTVSDGFTLTSEVTTNDAYVIQRENANLIFRTNDAERMRVNSSGNVGIGTTTPGSLLHLNKSSGAADIRLSSGGTLYGTMFASSADTTINSVTAIPLILGTNNTERMRVDSSGRLLIAKTSTSTSVNGFEIKVENNNASISVQKTASGAGNGLLFYHNGSYVGGLNYDNTSTSLATSSDERLKKDIADAGVALPVVNSVRVVSHGWKNDDGTVPFGVVAQELFNTVPQAVYQGDNGEEVQKVWGVDYVKLVPILVKAVQELSAKVEALEAGK